MQVEVQFESPRRLRTRASILSSTVFRCASANVLNFLLSAASLMWRGTARKLYRTRDEAKADVFDYIERFYNPKRRHSRIGYLSPMEFESQAGLA
jgi:transposase InsO family protein